MNYNTGENPYERETQRIKSKSSQQILQKLSQLAKLSKQRNFQAALQLLNQIQILVGNSDDDNSVLKQQLKFLTVMFQEFLGDSKSCESYYETILKDRVGIDRIRVIILNICSNLRNDVVVPDQKIIALCKLLEKYPQQYSEILFRLTGAKSLQKMESISYEEIQDLSTNEQQKAIKFQIVSDWKYLIENQKQAIRMKSQAMKIWKLKGKTSQASIAQMQQKSLIQMATGDTEENPYTKKLLTIKKIVRFIKDLTKNQEINFDVFDKQHIAMNFIISSILNEVVTQQQQSRSRSTSNKSNNNAKNSLRSSILKKQERIQDRIHRAKQFHTQFERGNYLCVQFVPKTRFSSQIDRNFSKKVGIFNRIIKKQYRTAQDQINNYSQMVKKRQQRRKEQQ